MTDLRFAALCLTAIFSPAAADELPDLLDTPALIAPRAETAALLDLGPGGDGLLAVGERGIILQRRADDWVQSPSPVGVTLTAVAENGEGTAIAVGHDGVILRSTDSGATWAKVTDGRALFPGLIETARSRHAEAEAALEEATEDTREDLEFELEDQLFRLETAEQSMAFGPSWPFLDVVFSDARTAWVSGAYGMLFRSSDGGASWASVSDRVENFEDLHLNALLVTEDGALLIAGEGGMIFRSADGGESFERWDTDDALSLFGLAESGGIVVAYGFGNSYQLSTDDGESWENIRLPANFLMIGDVELGEGRIGILGGSGLMVEVTEAGPGAPTRPTGERSFLSGGAKTQNGLIFTGEDGLAQAAE